MNIATPRFASRQEQIATVMKDMEEQVAEKRARHQAMLKNASPAEQMAEKRNALILQKRATDIECKKVSEELDRIRKSIKDMVKLLWRGADHDRHDKRHWSVRQMDRESMLEGYRADERDACQRFHEISARIEAEATTEAAAEINAKKAA